MSFGPRDARRASGDQRRLVLSLTLILAFMAAEVVVGLLVGSLALLADAAHMVTDAGALGLGIVAIRLAARPPAGGFTYGFKRAEILSALINGTTLAVLAVGVVYEAVHRLINPIPVDGRPVVAVALAGIAINLTATWILAGADRKNVNLEASFRHVVADLYAFIATAAAGLVIIVVGFTRADAIASIVVAILMSVAAVRLIARTGRALLEGAPEGINPLAVGEALATHAHVANVHDLHVWEITSGFPALSAHILVHEGDDCHAIRLELESLLRERFNIEHTTMQVDHLSDGAVHWMDINTGTRPP